MTNNSIYALLVFCEILQIVYSGNEPFNLFGLSKQNEMEDPEFEEHQEKLSFEDGAVTSEERILKKKRLLSQDRESQTDIHPDKYFINGEYLSKRRSNHDVAKDQKKLFEDMRSYKNNYWESERDRIRYSEEKENLGSPMEFRARDPVSGPHASKGGISEKSQSLWNAENNFKSVNSNPDPRVGSSYNDRTINGNINDYSGTRDKNVMDRRISITTLNEAEKNNKYRDDYRDMRSGYQTHSNMGYNSRKDGGFWDPNIYKHEKGVIINFNTECPTARQFNNQLVHRVILSPKSPITQSEISAYQFPGGGLISAHRMAPAYYL